MGRAAANLRATARAVERAGVEGTADAAEQIAQVARRVGRQAGGGRVRLDAHMRISGARAEVLGTPANQWSWVTDGTARHPIRPRRRVLWAPGYPHPVGRPVSHPGARAGHAWDRVAAEAGELAPRVVGEHIARAVTGG